QVAHADGDSLAPGGSARILVSRADDAADDRADFGLHPVAVLVRPAFAALLDQRERSVSLPRLDSERLQRRAHPVVAMPLPVVRQVGALAEVFVGVRRG